MENINLLDVLLIVLEVLLIALGCVQVIENKFIVGFFNIILNSIALGVNITTLLR